MAIGRFDITPQIAGGGIGFDTQNPTTQAFGDSPVAGTSGMAAQRDHKHGMPAEIDLLEGLAMVLSPTVGVG